MRISFRIILINFTIVVLILGSAGIAFYSIMFNVLTSQQSKYLVNSANSLIYSFESYKQEIEDEATRFFETESYPFISDRVLEKYRNIDFVFKTRNDSILIYSLGAHSTSIFVNPNESSISEFKKLNPPMIIGFFLDEQGAKYYYGKILSQDVLTRISKRINADIAVIMDDNIFEYSNETNNQVFFINIQKAFNALDKKRNFEIYSEETDNSYFIATTYKIFDNITPKIPVHVIIFSNISEVAELNKTLSSFLILLGFASILLSLILTLLFTSKIRKQLNSLSEGTRITMKGNFQNRLNIESKDEIGELATAFNLMLDELEKNEKAKNEYADFITLINQNPTLKEISENALNKIVSATGVTAGALFSVNEGEISFINSIGINPTTIPALSNDDFLQSTIRKRESKEIFFSDNSPIIETGLVKVELKYLIIIPIIYNYKVIALLELASVSKPAKDASDYIEKIKEQLAIGLTNSMALLQLENLVAELKSLNTEYQNQNLKIKKQNERLIELHNEITEKARELEIQKRKAEESTELKSQFLATMSHELRTPMNAILGLTELVLEDKTLPAKNAERLSVVLRSGKRLLNLINDILDLSKIEAGKMEIKFETFILEDLLSEISASMLPIANDKKLIFRVVRSSETNVSITTDKGKVIQILINLIGNALKFTEKGFVELRCEVAGNNQLVFKILDSGIGISQKEMDIIFHEFRQADSSPTRKYGGTGLGLSICKKFAEILNGFIKVESVVNQGSTFTFQIPVSVSTDYSHKSVFADEALTKIDNSPIIIVNGNKKISNSISNFLTSIGFESITSETGQRALALAKKIKPQAIVLDLNLPDFNAFSFLERLSLDEDTKSIKAIILSAIKSENLNYGLNNFYFTSNNLTDETLSQYCRSNSNYIAKEELKIVILSSTSPEIASSSKFDYKILDPRKYGEFTKTVSDSQANCVAINLVDNDFNPIKIISELRVTKPTKNIPILLYNGLSLSTERIDLIIKSIEEIAVSKNIHQNDVLKLLRDSLKKTDSIASTSNIEIASPSLITSDNSQNSTQEFNGEVLIVDDDPDSLFTINEIVQKCGCKTLLAKNGRECLEILENKNPNLILLDIMMPILDGFQTIRLIRDNEIWRKIPVLAVTAKAMLEEKEVILKYGFDGYVTKPVNPSVLAFKIMQYLSNKE